MIDVGHSLSGSGEGPGWATAPGYSTAAFSATSDKGPAVQSGRAPLRTGAIPPPGRGLKRELRAFCRLWFRNLRSQGFLDGEVRREVLS